MGSKKGNSTAYINLFQKDLESFINYDLDSLDNTSKKGLSTVYNDYGLAFYNLYCLSNEKKDLSKAKDIFNFAMRLDDKNVEPLLNFGFLLYDKENNYTEALKLYKKVLEINPNNGLASVFVDMCNEELSKLK